MQKFLLLILSLIFLLIACNKDSTFRVELFYENSSTIKEIQFYKKADSLATGKWETFFPNGNLMEERHYIDGKLHGQRLIYDENGSVAIMENYEHDQFEGVYEAYHPNGQVRVRGQYENNAMSGEWTYYYDNGQLKERVQFLNNLENGPFEEYYSSGLPKARGQYLEGDHEHGKLELYDSTGVLIKVMECNRGTCKTTWKL
jgi:antitoxin component YwqK of YwqJK toxin-antitoxin module